MYIELKNVTKKIRGVTVLDNVSLRMESGNIYMASKVKMEVVRLCL